MAQSATRSIRNWGEYNKALQRRGSITFWLDDDTLAQWHTTALTGKRGRPCFYTDMAIQCLLLIKSVFHLDFRKLAGFAESWVGLMNLPIRIPSYTQICRRQKNLEVGLGHIPRQGSLHVVVDATGLKVFGDGEWKVRQHGYSKRRTWRKLHLGIDEATGEIIAMELSTNEVSDGEIFPDLLNQIEETVNQVSADGAYDKKNCYDAIDARGAQANIPPRKNSVLKKHGNCKGPPLTRDKNIRAIRKKGRKRWKIEVGYHRRSLAETAMFRFKTLFSDHLSNRLFEHQCIEAAIKCQAMNKMTQLGMPQYCFA